MSRVTATDEDDFLPDENHSNERFDTTSKAWEVSNGTESVWNHSDNVSTWYCRERDWPWPKGNREYLGEQREARSINILLMISVHTRRKKEKSLMISSAEMNCSTNLKWKREFLEISSPSPTWCSYWLCQEDEWRTLWYVGYERVPNRWRRLWPQPLKERETCFATDARGGNTIDFLT